MKRQVDQGFADVRVLMKDRRTGDVEWVVGKNRRSSLYENSGTVGGLRDLSRSEFFLSPAGL